MFSKLRKRATFSNVLLVFVLVFAMTGGAYAASKYVITSTKQISPKVLKSLVGKTGTAGKEGAPGKEGPAGKEGASGKEGPAGKDGTPGKEGTAGTKGEPGPKGAQGEPGEAGPAGPAGPEGTTGFTKTLPSGQTETGTWSVQAVEPGTSLAPISFAIPLKTALVGHVFIVRNCENLLEPGLAQCESENKEQFGFKVEQICPGTVGIPKATAGYLCIYQGNTHEPSIEPPEEQEYLPETPENPAVKNSAGVGTTGGVMAVRYKGPAGFVSMDGTWAVTAS